MGLEPSSSESSCAASCCGCVSTPQAETATAVKSGQHVSAPTVITIEKMDCPTEEGLIRKRLATVDGIQTMEFDLLGRKLAVRHSDGALPAILSALEQVGMPGRLDGQQLQRSAIRVQGLAGAAEAARIRKRLAAEKGLQNVQIDPINRLLILQHPEGALPQVLTALQEIALDGKPVQQQLMPELSPPVARREHWAAENWTLLVGGVLAAAAELLGLLFRDLGLAVALLSLAAIALSGLETYRKGLIALRHRVMNINALMSIAVTGAVLIGQWQEAAMVMFLFGVAEAIEARSLARAKRAVESLMSMAPHSATVRTPSGWQELPASSVAIGSLVRVRPAERIPLDGVVTTGTTAVDQAPITGESVPVDKGVGDPLFAGTVNQNGEVEYRTTAAADQSTLARIIRTVQEAQASRAPMQNLVDRFSSVYTPAVVAIAVAVAVIPAIFFGGEWLAWIYRALVMLVVACPCALVISTPVTVVSGLTAAARRGILIKGGKVLEGGRRLSVLALDKTGTLTRGKPEVTDFIPLTGLLNDNLRLAAAIAARSDHPVSRAVAAYAVPRAGALPEVARFTAWQGRGTEGKVNDTTYRLGNRRLLEEFEVHSPELHERLRAFEEQGKTAIVLLADRTPQAVIAIADTVRPESADAVAQLKALGIRTVMLTGDNEHTAQTIARQLGIDAVRSELLPNEKLAAIERLQAGGQAVGMVGDGANDAPALAKADTGFAMGAAGTDAAIETADVALMDDDPRKLAAFIRLSHRTKSVLWQNIVLAIGIKAVFLAMAMFGQATLWMAVFADMGTSLLVVMNGMRLLRSPA